MQLVLSLLRLTDIVGGTILYDGVDITRVPRQRLRESLTMIPQDAVLFSGSVESNLDPSGLVPRERLEAALASCKGIASFSGDAAAVEEGGPGRAPAMTLLSDVDARGDNFSHGQRQVLALCRALVRRSRLMLLDEATANMDYETDRGIQGVVGRELGPAGDGRTLVTIAHRLRTIIDHDRVVVMGAGRVIECVAAPPLPPLRANPVRSRLTAAALRQTRVAQEALRRQGPLLRHGAPQRRGGGAARAAGGQVMGRRPRDG